MTKAIQAFHAISAMSIAIAAARPRVARFIVA